MAQKVGIPADQIQFDDGVPANQIAFDAPATSAGMGIGSSLNKELLTNQPVGFLAGLVRGIPATVGASIGAVAGPLGMVAGAGAGEALRQAAVSTNAVATNTQPPSVLESVGYPALAAGTQYLGGKIAEGLGNIVNPRTGAQLLKAGPATPEKYGQAVLDNPAILGRAQSPQVMGEAYRAFEKYTGLKGIRQGMEESAKLSSPGELVSNVLETMKSLKAGEEVSPQQLYTASQSAAHLKLAARFGEPGAARALEGGLIDEGKQLADSALQNIYPEYQSLRQGMFESKAAQEFQSLLPLNKNSTPNVLRSWAGGAAAMKALSSGNPAFLAPLALISPKVAGLAIRTGSAMLPVAQFATRLASQALAPEAAALMSPQSLQAYYGK